MIYPANCAVQLLDNRPLALRGHVANASFKQWVGILLMPKIVRAHKNYLTPEIWEETHLREIFCGTLIFQQSSMICIGRHVGGHSLALQHGGQNYLLLISCSTFHSYAQMCCKHYHIIFSTFSLKFKCKIWVQREVIHNFKNHILVSWPFPKAKSYNFHFHKNGVTCLLVQMAYWGLVVAFSFFVTGRSRTQI